MGKMRMKLIVSVAVCLVIYLASEAGAITAWARKYGADCSMCHWKQNKLNATGKEFLRRGHRMSGEDSRNKEGAWSNLSDYVSITQKIRFVNDSTQTAPERPGFFVEALSVYAGGPIDKTFSFFYEQYLHENNKSGADREKLAEAYLMATSSDNADYATFRIGQIAPYLLHYNGTGARLSVSRPYVLESASFASNNPYAPRGRQYGIEFALNKWGLYSALGVVNGTGHKNIDPAGDSNWQKDIYLTLEKNLDDNGSSLGIYGYNGTWSLTTANAANLGIGTAYVTTGNIAFNQIGLIGNYTNSLLSFFGGVLSGNNSPASAASTKNLGYYLQGEVVPLDALALYSRYDSWDSDTATSNNEATQVSVGVSVEPLTSGRIAVEGQSTKTTATASPTTKLTAEFQYMY